jgi:hypothetical protein
VLLLLMCQHRWLRCCQRSCLPFCTQC